MGILDTGYGNMPYGSGEYGDGTQPDPVLPDSAWGTSRWGLDCWGLCQASIWFYGWSPVCDSIGNDNNSTIQFGVKPSDLGDSITLSSIVVTITVDDIIYNPACGTVEPWNFNGIVYQNSNFVSPWSGTATPVNNGYEFSITPPVSWPPNAKVCVEVYVESAYELSDTVECCWTVEDVFCISVEIISLTKLLVTFSDKMRASNSGVDTITNWEIIPVASGFLDNRVNTVNIISVVPDGSSRNPSKVLLNTTKMVRNQRYKVKCKNLVDIYSRSVGAWSLFIMRRTKVDSALDGLPNTWEVSNTSNFFWILGSISKQDEKIGGSIDDVDI